MKKLFLLAAAFIMLSLPAVMHAQTAPAATPKATTGKMKKDGTPDKRYKANKAAASDAASATTTPTKKDGSPDMRYKANKGAAKTKNKATLLH